MKLELTIQNDPIFAAFNVINEVQDMYIYILNKISNGNFYNENVIEKMIDINKIEMLINIFHSLTTKARIQE